MTCLVSNIGYFHVVSLVQAIFIRLGEGMEVTAILCRSSSGRLGTPEVNIASVLIPIFPGGGNKMALSNLQIREEEQLPDRPEPVQIARDRSKYKTKRASDVKKVPLHDRINQFPGQHLSVRGNAIFCLHASVVL